MEYVALARKRIVDERFQFRETRASRESHSLTDIHLFTIRYRFLVRSFGMKNLHTSPFASSIFAEKVIF